MFVKPAPGVKVRDPISRVHLPESGKEVPDSSYWVRCLRRGDVVVVSPPVLEKSKIPDFKKAKE